MATGTAPRACDTPHIVNGGPRSISLEETKAGFRTYTVVFIVKIDRGIQGPATIRDTPGLPEPGSTYNELAEEDDIAYYTRQRSIRAIGDPAKTDIFEVICYATTEPYSDCATQDKDDPLQVNDRVHVESVDYQEEMVYDANDDEVVNSAYEQYRGQQVERDANNIRVVIEQNAADLDLELLESLIHHTNDVELWGFPAGQVKFSHFEGDPKYYTGCQKYWLRRYIFDVNKNGFDKVLLDEATKVLHGRWDQKTGSNCTLTLTTTGGLITSAVIATPGSDYPASSIVPLKVTTSGSGGIVLVETDMFGVVVGFIRVHKAGTGYSNGASNTTQRGKWVLLRYNGTGDVPTPNNPQHFDRPGDLKGQNTRFILDGKGMPIDEDEDPGNNEFKTYSQGNLLLLGIPLSLETP